MKRRGAPNRRQVLDVDNSSSAWKNKYQHSMYDRTPNGAGSKGDMGGNPLSKLVGNYASDSEGEDEGNKGKSSLDLKVEEFLKEVESTKTSEEQGSITCAWQECYDEGTGYPYYWNMNTNEVTWEIPPELVAYQAALAAKVAQSQAKEKQQAQHAQWAVEQAALGLTPDVPSVTSKPSMAAPPTIKKPLNVKDVAPRLMPKKTQKQRPTGWLSSDSEEEKIEMITSWVDEESEEDEEETQKKVVKSSGEKSQLKSKDNVIKSQRPFSGSSASSKTSKSSKVDPSPVTVYGPQLPEINKSRGRNGSVDDVSESEPKVVIQKLRRLKAETDVIVGTREKGPVRKSLDRSPSGSPSDRLNLKVKHVEAGVDSASAEEKLILARLYKQVKVLRDLGGEVPNDVRDLIESETKTSLCPPRASANNIIALIEMEQPPDHKQSKSYLSSLRAAEKSVENAVFKMKSGKSSNNTSVNDKKNIDSKPSSFALIAGYGEDSDQEDGADTEISANNSETKQASRESKGNTLFPILDHQDSNFSNSDLLFSRDKMKSEHENEPLAANKALQETSSKMQLVIDQGTGLKRKKRLDVPFNSKPLQSSASSIKESGDEAVKKEKEGNCTTSYTTSWPSSSTYTSDPTANDRRGFGFQVQNNEPEEPLKFPLKTQKGKIQFIKAETLNQHQLHEGAVGPKENNSESNPEKTTMKSAEDQEVRKHLSSLAQLVVAKLRFLSEGKEPVPPVQAMTIQIETLMSAWTAGALTQGFLHRWLQSMGAELVELERAAAPKGWAVQWDRTYKRYFYCNLATKDTQWDYPVVPETLEKPSEDMKETAELETKGHPSPPPEDDEDAMELCTTPPPEEEEPILSEPCELPSSPAPKRLKTDNGDESNIPNSNQSDPQQPAPPLPDQPPLPASPPPPLPSSPPPPPPDTPPPLPSDSPSPSHVTEHGEPLPPGVDTTELPYMPVRPALQSLSSELGPHLALNALQVGSIHSGPVMMTTMPLQYPASVSNAYVPPPPTEAMLASYNHASAVDYMGYMSVYAGPAAMPVASVAAPPLAYSGPGPQPSSHPPHMPQRQKEALLSELSSFYSDIASLDSNSQDAMEDETSQDATPMEQHISKVAPQPVITGPSMQLSIEELGRVSPAQDIQSSPIIKHVPVQLESTSDVSLSKRKKKPKLAPGLTLKKKGVSNLVAKWQQVQQEVWKDYQTLSDEDDN